MKRLVASHSQHFLRGSAFIAELVGHSNIRKNDTVIDIGAGSGAITAVLARRAKKVVAYESEPSAYSRLERNMKRFSNVEIVRGDFLRAELPAERYKVFSNIPFHLSSSIVRRLTGGVRPPVAIYLIVQKQFAQKMIVEGAHFHSALGMGVAPWWTARIRRPLRRTDFTPPPAVDTVLLELKLRDTPLLPRQQMQSYMDWIERCYADPRTFAKTTVPKNKKPSELTLEEWLSAARNAHLG